MHVDDIVGVCFVDDVEPDLKTARDIFTALLGSGAVADDKTEHGVPLNIIGYTVCLPTMRVLIARKNFLPLSAPTSGRESTYVRLSG
jgi:hypothetical protein